MHFDGTTIVIKCGGYGGGVGDCSLGVAETTHEVNGLAEEVFRRLRRSRLHQFEFEREFLGFGTAFRGEVVFTVEHIQRTRQNIGVIGCGGWVRKGLLVSTAFIYRQRLRRDSSLTFFMRQKRPD